MKTKKLFSALFIAIILFSCNRNSNEEQPSNINSVVIAKDVFMHNHINPSNLAIHSQTEWNDFLAQIESSININYVFGQSNIDFQNEMAIAVIDSVYPTGGWSVEITDIIEHSDDIEIQYTNLEKGDDTEIIVQPFIVIKIPTSIKPIVFIKN